MMFGASLGFWPMFIYTDRFDVDYCLKIVTLVFKDNIMRGRYIPLGMTGMCLPPMSSSYYGF